MSCVSRMARLCTWNRDVLLDVNGGLRGKDHASCQRAIAQLSLICRIRGHTHLHQDKVPRRRNVRASIATLRHRKRVIFIASNLIKITLYPFILVVPPSLWPYWYITIMPSRPHHNLEPPAIPFPAQLSQAQTLKYPQSPSPPHSHCYPPLSQTLFFRITS